MKLGILADTHNHIENTRRALDAFRERGITRLIHCGDLTTVAIVELFAGFSVTFVFGNSDQFHADLMQAAKALFGMGSMGYSYTAAIDDKRIAVCHGNDEDMLNGYIQQNTYDFVFHGHTHHRRDEIVGKTRVINPGALGGNRPEQRSICILDFETEETEFVMIEE